MDVFDPKRLTDLAIDIRQAEMPPASPMAVRFVGHPVINRDGSTSISTTGSPTPRSRAATASSPRTSNSASGSRATGSSIFPSSSGSRCSPTRTAGSRSSFPSKATSTTRASGSVTPSPRPSRKSPPSSSSRPSGCSASSAAARDDEDFGFVEFRAGGSRASRATPPEKLATLVAGADQRPELVLLVEGSWDLEADTLALKEVGFDAAVANLDSVGDSRPSISWSRSIREGASREASGRVAVRVPRPRTVSTRPAYYRDPARRRHRRPGGRSGGGREPLPGLAPRPSDAFIVEPEGGDDSRVRVVDPVALEETSGRRLGPLPARCGRRGVRDRLRR